jgi:hypothetical protein
LWLLLFHPQIFAVMADLNRGASFLVPRASASNYAPSMAGGSQYGGDHSEFAAFKKTGFGSAAVDVASDTSSVRERKFAVLLGEAEDSEAGEMQPPARNVGHRLYYKGTGRDKQKQEFLRDERDRQLMTEMTSMSQRPSITGRARQKPSKGAHFADHADMWQRQRDHNVREMTRVVSVVRDRDNTGSPAINKHSQDLIAASPGYKGPVRNWDTHFAKFCAKRSKEFDPNLTFSPNINANAVRVDLEQSIGERLYAESEVRRERTQQVAQENRRKSLIDAATGRPYFTPQSLGSVSGPISSRDVEELSQKLYEDHADNLRRRDDIQASSPEHCYNFTPKLNVNTEMLAGRARKPLYQSPAQREEDKEQQRLQRVARGKESERSQSGPIMHATPVNVDDFLRRAQRNEMSRANKMQHIRDEQEERSTRECTFQPSILAQSEAIFQNSNMSGTPMRSPMDPSPSSQQMSFSQAPSAVHSARKTPTPRAAAQPQQVQTPRGEQSPRVVTHSVSPSPMMEDRRAAGSPKMSAVKRASPSQGRTQAAEGTEGMENVDHYIASFEKQMYAVLEEWRQLEEV